VPFSVALGLFTVRGLALALVLAPVVLLGAWAGLRVVSHLNRKLFERLVLAGSTLAAVNLLR